MSNKSEKPPVSAEAKKQLEAMAGANIEQEQLIGFRFPVGAFDYTEGSSSWRSIIVFPQPLTCTDANLLDASGLTTTGANGSASRGLPSPPRPTGKTSRAISGGGACLT